MESPKRADEGLRLAGALSRYWEVRSHFKQGRELYTAILKRPEAKAHTRSRAKALTGAGRLAWCQDDDALARHLFTMALEIYRELGDKKETGFVLAYLAFVERSEGEIEQSRKYFDEADSLAQELNNDRMLRGIVDSGRGTVAADDGDLQLSRELKEKSLKVFREAGDIYVVGLLSWSLARVFIYQGDYQGARALLEECVATSRLLGNKWSIPYYLEGFGEVASGEGNAKRAAQLFGAGEALREKIGLAPSPPRDRLFYDKAVQVIREALPPEEFKAAWELGRGMKAEQALAYALGSEEVKSESESAMSPLRKDALRPSRAIPLSPSLFTFPRARRSL